MRIRVHVLCAAVLSASLAAAADPEPVAHRKTQSAPAAATAHVIGRGNRLAYLDECDPYYVSRSFPKLITPQWVGEPEVEAVVVLAIDDDRYMDVIVGNENLRPSRLWIPREKRFHIGGFAAPDGGFGSEWLINDALGDAQLSQFLKSIQIDGPVPGALFDLGAVVLEPR